MDGYHLILCTSKYISRLRRHVFYSSGVTRQVKDLQIWPKTGVFKERFIFTSSTSFSHEKDLEESDTSTKLTNVKSHKCTNPAKNVHENVVTIPNMLCVSRIVAAPYLAHVVINTANFPWALAIFGYAALTDAVRAQEYCWFKFVYFTHQLTLFLTQ